MTNKISKAYAEENNSKKLKKKFYTSYSKLSEVKLITIGLASPERIKQWAEKTLPNGKILGEVMNANTLHHKTFKPQKGGLFCERIFGPLKDFECACGKPLKFKKEDKLNKQNQTKTSEAIVQNFNLENNSQESWQPSKNILNLNKSILGGMPFETKTKNFCNICEVEYTWSVMRRYQLGYINLISPVTHVWYLKGNPSYLSILLDMKKRHLEYIAYCSETLTLENGLKGGTVSSKSSDIVSSWKKLKIKIMSQRAQWANLQQNNLSSEPELDESQLQKKLGISIDKKNSVEKRQKLKLKKYSFWKQFYNSNHSESLDISRDSEWYTFFLNPIMQMKIDTSSNQGTRTEELLNFSTLKNKFKNFNNFSTNKLKRKKLNNNVECSEPKNIFSEKELNNYLTKYSKKINPFAKNLKYLSFLIIQNKQELLRLKKKLNNFNRSFSQMDNFIIDSKIVQEVLENERVHLLKLPVKQIFKKISISSYILLNLNIFSQKLIYENLIDTVWQKLLQKAYKKALIRTNKIFNRIDSKVLNPYEQTAKSFYFKNQCVPALQQYNGRAGQRDTRSEFLHLNWDMQYYTQLMSLFVEKIPKLNNKEDNLSIKLKFLIKKIKNYVYNTLNSFIFEPLFNQETSKKQSLSFCRKEIMLFKSKTIELHTLSNFPSSISNFLISNFLLNTVFIHPNQSNETDKKSLIPNKNIITSISKQNKVVLMKKQFLDKKHNHNLQGKPFKIIIENLTSIFLKTFLKNKSSKYSSWIRSINFKKNSGSVKNICSKDNTLNFKKFKKIKNSLINFYLIGKLANEQRSLKELLKQSKIEPILFYKKIKSNQPNDVEKLLTNKDMQSTTLYNYFQTNTNREELLSWTKSLKNKIKENFIIKNKTKTENLFFQVDPLGQDNIENKIKKESLQGLNNYTKFSFTPSVKNVSTKKLYNNVYCLSHRERWEVDNDWNFLYYYITVQNFETENNTGKVKLFERQVKISPVGSGSFISQTPSDAYTASVSSFASTGQKSAVRSNNSANYNVESWMQEKIIPNYKNRFENVYTTNFLISSKSSYANPSFASKTSSLNHERLFDEPDMRTQAAINTKHTNVNKSTLFSGPGIIQLLLSEFSFFEIKKIDKQNRILLYQLNKQILKLKKRIFNRTSKKELKDAYKKRDLLIRRTKLVRKLFIKESPPQATILTVLPVLPPDLRPIVKMGGQIAASDLNRLYQRVIYRNDRLKKFLKDPATSHSYEMKYAQRLLQEAVDNLIQNGKSGVVTEKDSRGRALKSLSDILKGKQGRFRQYLLGKRVDYSGRSVIVVGPRLKLHECGIPKEMALELYLPFLLKRILNDNLARTIVGAKMLIKTNPSLVWELLREIMQTCPVLLNRAPTLHRLGIQAFQPKLIDGRAILLHPLVCSAFNADFDGDQMAVHVPITVEARAEAWKLMLSRNSILSPATGEPLAIPSQDMVLGCYYLTTNLLNKGQNQGPKKDNSNVLRPEKNLGCGFYFSKVEHVLKAYELKKINLHANIWLKWTIAGFIDNGSDQEEPIEIRLDSFGNWKEIYSKSQKRYNLKNICLVHYIFTTPGKIIFNLVIQKALK